MQDKKKEIPFDDDLLIHQCYVMMRLFTKTLNEHLRTYGLYSAEWTIMNYLMHNDHILQSKIAADLEIEPAAISKTLRKMEKKGLICKSSLTDKREKYISLTDAGKSLFPTAAEIGRRHRRHVLADVSDEQMRHMLTAVSRMIINMKNKE